MKILKVQALRGPNLWSIQRKKLIQMSAIETRKQINETLS
jgi:hypothetical protein